MRINIYAEELTERIEVVNQEARTGGMFYGLRVYLKSPPELHQPTAENNQDDDTSAITFWFASEEELELFADRGRDCAMIGQNR